MDLLEIRSKLDEFGDAKIDGMDDGGISLVLECEINSTDTIEELNTYIDNLPSATLELTGNKNGSLWIVQISPEEINRIPPYLEDGWRSD